GALDPIYRTRSTRSTTVQTSSSRPEGRGGDQGVRGAMSLETTDEDIEENMENISDVEADIGVDVDENLNEEDFFTLPDE
ncbi:hypothetical protein Droror1_Dr00027329, partial [Drosera rotundifolia]